MIDVVFAEHQELFQVGVAEVLAEADDICLLAQARSEEQLLSILGLIIPHVLVLSTSFLPVFSKIEPLLHRHRTALLLLAEENDRIAYVRWLRAQGIVYRSMEGQGLIDAMRRVARGELLIQDHSFSMRNVPCDDDMERPIRHQARG